MSLLWEILQFVLRLAFGVSLAMAITSPKQVTSGFFKVHLWVIMGLNVFAGLVVWTVTDEHLPENSVRLISRNSLLILVIGIAVLSYIGAVSWLYEKTRPGQWILAALTVFTLITAYQSSVLPVTSGTAHHLALLSDIITSGLVVGSVTTAMLLGHWYLNTPTMNLIPLRKLLWLCVIAIVLRTLLSGTGTMLTILSTEVTNTWWIFVSLRWISGILTSLGLIYMTFLTLRVPNTQSATGILYAATIVVFIGELTARVLADNILYPL
ncbi:MAG: hypothetical protein CMJ76_11750 [Planctomycetaceae bacterium]|nr:hypothetical protein [Planctomycetaceae bacterium]